MRLGNFWGLPAPMTLIMFDGNYDKLYEYLTRFNSEINQQLMFDICNEYSFMLQQVQNCSWSLPEFERVSEQYNPDTDVTDGVIEGADDLKSSLLITESCYKFLEIVLKLDSKGDYKELPKDVRGYVTNWLKKQSFPLGRLKSILRKAAEALDDSASSSVHVIAAQYGLVSRVPDYSWWDGKRYELNDKQKVVWSYFHERADVIKKCIDCCSGKVEDEELIFGFSFFDLIKRKPISIEYLVKNVFDRVKDRQSAKMLPDCISTCREEVQKFKDGLQNHVDYGDSTDISVVTQADFLRISADYSDSIISFFKDLIADSRLTLADLKVSDFEMLFDICQRIEHVSYLGADTILGVSYDSFSEFIDDCCHIGICGINDCSSDLFADAITNVSLAEQGKIKKSESELNELLVYLQDINALFDTLLPIGTNITVEVNNE